MFDTNPERSVDELLAAIQAGSVSTMGQQHFNFVGEILSPFAALLVHLSRDAEKTAKRMEDLTKRLLYLTILLLAFTFLLVAKEFYGAYADAHRADQTNQHSTQEKHISAPVHLTHSH